MHYIILPILGLLAAWAHLFFKKQARSAKRILEIFLAYGLACNVGLSGIYAFMGHAFAPDQVAAYIGWPPGSPFQFEIAIANLSFGVLGILCFWLRGDFWLATIIGYSIFVFGAAYGHVVDIVLHQNYAPGNAGPSLYADVIVPLLFVFLYALHKRLPDNK